MQRVLILMLAMASSALTGCTMTGKKFPYREASSGPIQTYDPLTRGGTYVYNGIDQDAVDARAKDLQSQGMSRDRAVSKATREANRQVWSVDSTEDAAYERARVAYQQQQDELNEGLRKLLADRAAR